MQWDDYDSLSPTWRRTDQESQKRVNIAQLGLVLIYNGHNTAKGKCHT